jgi:hypothetical protein
MEGQDIREAINRIEYPSTYKDISENISLLKAELGELRDKLILFQDMFKKEQNSEQSKANNEFIQRVISDLESHIKIKEATLSVYEDRMRLVTGQIAG